MHMRGPLPSIDAGGDGDAGQAVSERRNQAAHGDAAAGSSRRRQASHGRTAIRYLAAAAGCVLFAVVYAQFSHGVYSPYMTYMFAIPLVGGFLPALCLKLAKAAPLPLAARQAWGLALAALTVASCLRGIFEIAGTGSAFLPVYLVAAAAFAAIALISLVKAAR